mgnify:CR=1 FL=1
MAKINPKDEKFSGGGGGSDRTPHCGVGKKLIAAVGFERFESRNNNPMLGVRFVCLVDNNDETNDVGAVTFDNFALTDAAMWRLVDYAKAVKFEEPFDPEIDEDIGKVLTKGFCLANLVSETFKGRTSIRPGSPSRNDPDAYEVAGKYDEDPAWAGLIEAAEDGHREYLDWRAKNPRGDGGSSNGGGGGGGSSSGGGNRGDIPF